MSARLRSTFASASTSKGEPIVTASAYALTSVPAFGILTEKSCARFRQQAHDDEFRGPDAKGSNGQG